MKSESECEQAAELALERYVNGCACDSAADAVKAVSKMLAVAAHARELLAFGEMEKLQ